MWSVWLVFCDRGFHSVSPLTDKRLMEAYWWERLTVGETGSCSDGWGHAQSVEFSCLVMFDSATPWTAARQASLFITSAQSLLKLMSIELVMPSTISSSVVPFSSRLQSFPASGSFPMSQFFPSGGQSIGVSASASVLPMNIQDWFSLGDWLDLLAVQGTLNSLLQQHNSKPSILRCSAFFIVQL